MRDRWIRWRFLLPVVCAMASLASAVRAADFSGELHLAELNCAACHEAPQPVLARLASKKSPVLGENGARVTPQWLRAHLLNPQGEKPGTSMPDMLHALPENEKREAAEALTHYLVSLQKKDESAQAGYSTTMVKAGRGLFNSVGCVACHAPMDAPGQKETKDVAGEIEKLSKESVPLGSLAKKFSVMELAAFLKNPLKTRASGRMPSLNLGDTEAQAIATYLLREQAPAGPAQKIAGLKYEYFEGGFNRLPQFDKLKVLDSGITDVISLKPAKKENGYALRFRGVIVIPAEGEYEFFSNSDDGSQLFIDEKMVVDNDGEHAPAEKSGKVKLKSGDHTFMVTFFQGGGGAEFKVQWKAPNGKKEPISGKLLFHEGQPMKPIGDEAFTVDAGKAAKGKDLFASLNCAACHTSLNIKGTKSKPLAELKGDAGCLSANPPAKAPKFTFSEAQRAGIHAVLNNQAALSEALSPKDQAARTLTALSCTNCHSREKLGGPKGFRREYFIAHGETDLGEEGAIPPHLTGVGNKLKPEWMKKVLWGAALGAARPYMATRMPQFGKENVEPLIAALEAADAPEKPWQEAAQDEALVKHGQKLIGTQGLSCVACHVFGGRPGWSRAYLQDPQRLRPGTRMPEFFPDGAATNKTILGGDMEKQISAMWSYLSKGKAAEVPVGLHKATMELAAVNEALIYRHFVEGSGSRSIAVGYPEKANLSFDANHMRLAMLWQGGFIDAAKHRTGRGTGFEKPLGSNIVKFPDGAPFAVLADANEKWPAGEGKAAGYQFRGYSLDDKQRPAFRYEFRGVKIEDYPVASTVDADSHFTRTFTFINEKPSVIQKIYFRAAVGKIEEANGAFILDGKVKFKFSGATPMLRTVDGKQELLVPVVFQGNEAKFVEEFTW
jgi:mono/diheme cytochrome c family protein